MDKVNGRLTVFFDNPFWIGVFEVACGGFLAAAKVTFGAEPTDNEVYEFVLAKYGSLRFGPAVAAACCEKNVNPKRRQRNAREELLKNGVGTKSQQALKQMQEQGKILRKNLNREKKEEEIRRKYNLKQQKKKQKHKGH